MLLAPARFEVLVILKGLVIRKVSCSMPFESEDLNCMYL